MKQLTLFLLLSLFIISCGDDDDPITPNDTQSESLMPLADGNKWFMDLRQNNGNEEQDRISKYYITFRQKGEYTYEGSKMNVFTMYFVNPLDTTEFVDNNYFFEYNDYVYSTSDSGIEEHTITSASPIFITKIEKEGVIYIDSRKYNVQKSNFELDGKTHFAWELKSISNDPNYTFIEKYIPGIGIAYRFIEDKEYGTVREETLYKYELN